MPELYGPVGGATEIRVIISMIGVLPSLSLAFLSQTRLSRGLVLWRATGHVSKGIGIEGEGTTDTHIQEPSPRESSTRPCRGPRASHRGQGSACRGSWRVLPCW